MMTCRPAFVLVVIAAVTPTPALALQRAPEYVIDNVSVISMNRPGIAANQSVFVRDQAIVAIEPAGTRRPSANARVIDGRGKYLIPGLADMHVHVWAASELPLYVANGVTLVRNMWGESTTLALRRGVDSGSIIGPRIITAGKLVDGDPPTWGALSGKVKTPAEARALMDAHRAAGFDFFKIYDGLSRETFDAIAAHSKATGFRFGGHVPQEVPIADAMRSGMATIEHLTGWGEGTRAAGSPMPMPRDPARLAKMAAIAVRLRSGATSWSELIDSTKRRDLAQLAALTGVANVPTLIVLERIFLSREQAADQLARREMRFIAPEQRASWNPDTDFRFKGLSPGQIASLSVLFEEQVRRVAELHRAGARIMVGTDAPNPFVMHGFAIHEELAHLVAAGLTPYEALAAATTGPAAFLGQTDRWGTVQVGRRADLVLLDANPLADIGATRAVAGVMLNGRWLDRAALDAELERIAAGYAVPAKWFANVATPRGAVWEGEYRYRYNDAPVAAERVGAVPAGSQQERRIGQARYKDGAYLGLDVVRLERPRGHPVNRLTMEIAKPSGSGRLSIERTPTEARATGVGFSGAPIAKSVAGSDLRLQCAATVCLESLIPDFLGLAPGATTTLAVAMVEDAFELGIHPEEWVVMREARTDSAVYTIQIARGSEKRTTRLTLAGGRIATQRTVQMMGVVTVTREP